MKHELKVTVILLGMFFITQLIGLVVIHAYEKEKLPYGMEPPEEIPQETSIISILFAFAVGITLFFILTKINAEKFIRVWFFIVTIVAIGLTLNAFFIKANLLYSSFIALVIAIPLAYLKIFERNILVHNLTEFLIYPGIAAVFVPLLGVIGIIILLLIISLYDIWAVWHSGFMQQIAKYQINNLKIFTGFFLPYASKKEKRKIEKIKERYAKASKKTLEEKLRKAKIKINLAILGGGDIIFPIIAAGVFYRSFSLLHALIIIIFSTLALFTLFLLAEKKKFYPAMPFLSIGIYLGMIVGWLI